jgi:hypothetical protein
LRTYQLAEQHAAAGQATTILDVKLPMPFLSTAGGFLEKYGPDERYNYLQFLAGVGRPTLITLGDLEVADNMAFRAAPDAVRELVARRKNVEVEMIAGADHLYSSVRGVLIERLERWLRRVLPH